MKKSTLVPLLVFVLLAGGLFYVFSTFQINLFKGKTEKFDHFTLKREVSERSFSFGDVLSGDSTLDAGGWAIMAGIIIGIPLIFAMLSRRRIKRKEKVAMMNSQNETTP